MSEISALQSAVTGIHTGLNRVAKDASDIRDAGRNHEDDQDLVKPIVNLVADRNQVQASAKAAKIADGTIGTLLDVVA